LPKTKFTTRLRNAVTALQGAPGLGLVACRSGSLFSPIFVGATYTWSKVMESDGLLVAPRIVKAGEGGPPDEQVEILLGVIVQSEDATSQTKPNPLGKAALGHVPNGIWVDIADEGRRRLDRVLIVFVLPKGAAFDRQASFATAKRNVENAAALMTDVKVIEIARGESATTITKHLRDAARPFLRGRGRPRKS